MATSQCNGPHRRCARHAGSCRHRHDAQPIVRRAPRRPSSRCLPRCVTRSAPKQATGSGSERRHMKPDERNLPLSTDSAEAAALFDRAVEHYLKYHIDTMSLVGRALAADPDFVMAHCLKGYLLLSAANPANRQQIAATLAAVEANAANA